MVDWALPPGHRLKRNKPSNNCGFCLRKLKKPRPREDTFSADTPLGGQCSCGAGWVIDPTGKSGGQSMLDALSIVCQGDVSRAMALTVDEDYEVKETLFKGLRVMKNANPPRIWAARLMEKESAASAADDE